MIIKEVAARVNYYKCKRIPINWDRVKTLYNADRNTEFTTQELRHFYETNFEKSLDDIYLIKRVVGMSGRHSGYIQIQWEGFEVDAQDPYNYVHWKALPIELFEEFQKAHPNTAPGEFSKLSADVLRRLAARSQNAAFKAFLVEVMNAKTNAFDNPQTLNKVEQLIREGKYCAIQLQVNNAIQYVNFTFDTYQLCLRLDYLKNRRAVVDYLLDFLFGVVIAYFVP